MNLETEVIWAYTISAGLCITLASILLSCVCCRKQGSKDDLLGLDGMVKKINNPDENVNHMPESANCVTVSIPGVCNHDVTDSCKRPSGTSNPHRSLPDIPISTEIPEANADANSEIYATVDGPQNFSDLDNGYARAQHPAIASCSDAARPSLSQQSSMSQSDAPYARLKSEHPYDKLKKTEHPYASVQRGNDASACNGTTSTQNVNYEPPLPPPTLRTSTVNLTASSGEPVPPPRSRRASSHNSLPDSPPILFGASSSDIPAATAVAGQVAASQELPYMTPPSLQPNFSGDSQDSSKGYTSISVREPLANILAQTHTVGNRSNRRQELTDPHYATVSDDSDEVYAAIDESNQQVYTSGSETYAQIQPVTVENQNLPSALNESDVQNSSEYKSQAPQPPSVDSLRQVAQVHSRQASSSSCTSSVANLGSPKPEKRQANSPLPPRPPISPEPRTNRDDMLRSTTSVSRNLEDMYAKVQKNKSKKQEDESECPSSSAEPNNQLRRNSTQSSNEGPSKKPNFQFDAASRKSWSSRESVDRLLKDKTEFDNEVYISDPDIAKDVKIDFYSQSSNLKIEEHCYETLNKKKSSPNSKRSSHDSISQRQLPPIAYVNYDNQISGPESILSNDPGYEVLNRNNNRPPSDSDPSYEVLKPQQRSQSVAGTVDCSGYSTIDRIKARRSLQHNSGYAEVDERMQTIPVPLYSTINKKAKKQPDPGYEEVKSRDVPTEPNYESVPSDCADEHSYTTISGKSGSSETDSNYESIHHSDSNYESVKYIKNDPPYERLHNEDSNNAKGMNTSNDSRSSGSCSPVNKKLFGYETVSAVNSNNVHTKSNESEQCTSSNHNRPGYETIGKKTKNYDSDSSYYNV